MVPPPDPGGGINAQLTRGEHPLPFPAHARLRIFFNQPIGQPHPGDIRSPVSFPQSLQSGQLRPQFGNQSFWQDRHSVLVTLAGECLEPLSLEIQVMDPQAQQFHQAQARTIGQLGHEPAHA